jgi:hypothetical protein
MNDRCELKYELINKGTYRSTKLISYDEMIKKIKYKKPKEKYFVRQYAPIDNGLYMCGDYEIDKFEKEMVNK